MRRFNLIWAASTVLCGSLSAQNVGIGTATPTQKLEVTGNGYTSALIKAYQTTGTFADLRLTRARGTMASPSAVQSGDALGRLAFFGYNGTSDVPGAYVGGWAAENYTGIANGAGLGFLTTGIGATVPNLRMTLTADGALGLGTSTPTSDLHVVGSMRLTGAFNDGTNASGTLGQVLTSTGSVTQWVDQSALDDDDWTITGNDQYSAVSGNVGIGTSTPNATAKLHLDLGSSLTEGLLVTGANNFSGSVPNLGAGSRLMFYPAKSAFRSGYISGAQWNDASVGFASVAMGINAISSGFNSFSMGQATQATGSQSTALGFNTVASGNYSTSMGEGTVASGNQSTSVNRGTRAEAFAATAVGSYNVGGGTATSWVSSDPIFEIGVGTASASRANAMTVLKSGNVGIGELAPTARLDIVTTTAHALDINQTVNGVSSRALEITITKTGGSATRGIEVDMTDNGTSAVTADGAYIHVTGTNNNAQTGVRSILDGSGTGGHYGFSSSLLGASTGDHSGVASFISGTGTGTKYGVQNLFQSAVAGQQEGVRNTYFGTTTDNKYGTYNEFNNVTAGLQIGLFNSMQSNNASQQFGMSSSFSGTSNGAMYGTFTNIFNTATGSGAKHGHMVKINAAAGGTHYGIFADVPKAGSYAAVFIGDVAIGNSLGVDSYILPAARGTNNQIMVTDATGNVSWQNASTIASGTLDQAYDFGGAGSGRTVTADNGAVLINGTDGLDVRGPATFNDNSSNYDFRVESNNQTHMLFVDGGLDQVGIGTANPNRTLHIHDANNVQNFIQITGSATGTAATDGALIGVSNSIAYLWNYEAAPLYMGTNTSTDMVIDAAGNVGIATTTPSELLDVAGNATVDQLNINSAFTLPTADGTADQIMITDGAGTVAWQDLSTIDGDWVTVGADIERQSGNVYVGNTSGTNNDLYISDRIYDWDNTSYWLDPAGAVGNRLNEVILDDGSAADPSLYFAGDANTGFFSPATDQVAYSINGTERIRVDAAGEVGIGTTVPGALLDVRGDAVFNDNAGNNDFRIESQSDANQFFVDASAGSVGIGISTPSHRLHIHHPTLTISYMLFTNTGTGTTSLDGMRIGNTSQQAYVFNLEASSLHLGTSATARVTINSAGDVGIGTVSPVALLDVRGDAIFNEAGGNFDFRIEGDADPQVFVVDASNDNIGLGRTPSSANYFVDAVADDFTYGIHLDHNDNTVTAARGINVDLDNTFNTTATGYSYGAYVHAHQTNGSDKDVMGGAFFGFDSQAGSGTRFAQGVRGIASVSSANGTTTSYGVYGSFLGNGDTEYAGYFAGNVYTTGSYLSSDRKLKSNIVDYSGALDALSTLQPVRYTYRIDEYNHMNLPEVEQIGFTAENVEQQFPQLVKKTVQPAEHVPLKQAQQMDYDYVVDPNDPSTAIIGQDVEFEAVNYTGLVPVLVKAIQEQQDQIEELRHQNEQQQAELNALKEKLGS